MTNIDIVFAILLFAFILWGTLKGIIWTIVRFGSFAGVILTISNFKEEFRFKLSELIHVSPAIATVILYVVVFLVVMFIGKLVYDLLMKLIKGLKLGCFNRAAGGILSGASCILLLAMIVILIDLSPLSLNGRGVRPQDHKLHFNLFSQTLEDEVSKLKNDMPEMELDRIWEALDEANNKFDNASSKPERDMAITNLYKSLQSSLKEQDFKKISNKLQIQQKALAKFKGKDITIPSIFLQEVIEPLADYLEIKFIGIRV